MNERAPAEVFSPGEYLNDELQARGWSQVDFAEIIGKPAPVVNQIIAARRSVTPELAKLIAAALGTSPMLWLNLEAAFRLHADETPVSTRIARHARLRGKFAVREMVKRGWIEGSEDPAILESQVLRFFGISDIDETPKLAHAAKKSGKLGYPEGLNAGQRAWLFRVKQIAAAMPVSAYSESALRASIPNLRTLLLSPEGVMQVPKILAECGVRFVIVEHVASSKIDGVTFWLDGKSPVIGMSLRLDKIDNFWFVLRHEIEHVLNKHGREEAIVDADSDAPQVNVNDEERIANAAGADFCVPDADMTDFLRRTGPLISEEKVLNFALRMQVHPGLVVGQIQKRTGRWKIFQPYLVKIRHLITPVAMTDGYGQIIPIV
jgi:HTH-type transcriptional regulator/antitoxin HigA